MDTKYLMCHSRPPEGHSCNGCAVCTLPCPVWNQTHDLSMTFCGRARAVQAGACADEVRDSVRACLLCGSCEPVCSYGTNTVERTIALRAELGSQLADPHREATPLTGSVMLFNSQIKALGSMAESIAARFSAAIAGDNAEDIADAMETGSPVADNRVASVLRMLAGASEVVTTDGLLHRLLINNLKGPRVIGIGEAMLASGIELEPADLYVIDSRTYHSDFGRLVKLYDSVRKRTGCMMNLDLHRVATPTGASRFPREGFNIRRQTEWIMEGRPAGRVIVERIEDVAAFEAVVKVPVVFVGAL